MKSLLYTLVTGCFVAAIYWAYDVNYQTRAVEVEIRELRSAIRHEKETTKVLETEWSYLNRPERLSALAEEHFEELALAPMRAEHFARASAVAYPLPPNAEITEPVDAASRDDEEEVQQ